MSTRTTPRALAAVVACATLSFLAACGTSQSGADAPSSAASQSGAASSSAAADTFPVTVTHVFGETTIEKKPERIATIGWGNHEVPLALGVVPVGMSKDTWGDDNKNGMLPWTEAKVKELGGTAPVLFDDTAGIDFEAVANTTPDVILAAYSGLTQEEYDTLSKIAPVIAYPKTAWATDLDDWVAMDAAGMGRGEEGKQLVADLDTQIKDIAAKHPGIAGKSAMFTFIDTTDLSKIGFYGPIDPRAAQLKRVGMTEPKAVAATANSGQFWNTISAEKSDELSDVDVLVTYCKDEAAVVKAVQGNKLWAAIPAVKDGAIACLPDDTPVASAANPTPLNVSTHLDEYLTIVEAAAAKVK